MSVINKIRSRWNQKRLMDLAGHRIMDEMEENPSIKTFFKKIPSLYHVKHDGITLMVLNPMLTVEQKLTVEQIEAIKNLHKSRIEIFELMHLVTPTNIEDPEERKEILHKCAGLIEEIEFLMQREWGFSEDRNYHSWWYKVPHCCCPPIDNAERIGTPYRIISQLCPVHWENQEIKNAEPVSV